MENALTLADVYGMIRRRWWIPVLTVTLGAPVALAIAIALPPVYASTARILVESQVIPETLARSTVAQSASERIALIQQRLMTRDNLLEIARDNNVFADRPDLSPSQVVDLMNGSTRIRATSTADGRDRTVTGVEISFRAQRPAVAARVANDLVSRMLAQNARSRTDRATSTLAFFEQEVRRLETEIGARGAEIERFKSENQGSLPDSLNARQGELNTLRDRSFSLATQRAALDEQRRLLEQELARGFGPSGPAQSQELERLRSALVSQRATLAESHPTIRMLQARIAAMEAVQPSTPASAASGDEASLQSESTAQLGSLERQIAIIDRQVEMDAERMREIEESIERTPAVQIRLETLNRAHEGLQMELREAIAKRSQAEMGERLEASQQAERFQVIEQATAPDSPVAPNRPMIIAAGIVGSGGLGVGLMLLAEFLNRSWRTPRDVERQLRIRPIATVPYLRTSREVARRRWLVRLFLAAVLLGPPIALFAIDQLVMPLPLAAERLMEATGVGQLIESMTMRFGG